MPVVKQSIYMDHAAVAPLSRPAQQAVTEWVQDATNQGDQNWPTWARRIEDIRKHFAHLINAGADEIAMVPNTTSGINFVASGLNWSAGDNVVSPEGEFPSNLFPWLALEQMGVELRRVPVGPLGEVDLNQLAEACDERTRLITSSWVAYSSGYRIDVKQVAQIAHDHGALFFLDAIQGLGVFPLDVAAMGVDFLAADGHKWMLGPEGAGFFYSKLEHLDKLQPFNIGWNSVNNSHDFTQVQLDLRHHIGRYEGGSQNMIGFHALGASLDLLSDLGLNSTDQVIGDRVLDMTNLLCQELQNVGAAIHSCRESAHASGIVRWDLP